MKKIFLMACSVFAALSMNAEMVVQVKPFTVAKDATEVYAEIEIINTEHGVGSVGFDLYLPDGAKVYTNSSGKLITSSFSLIEDRTNYVAYDEEEEDDVNFKAMQTFDKNFQVDSDGVTFFRAGATGTCNIQGTSGSVFKLRIKFDGTLEDGVYPIQVKNVKLIASGAAMTTTVVPDATSYFVVGNPTEASVKMTGILPSFVNEALQEQTGIKTLDLSEVTAFNGEFAYTVGRAVTAPALTADVKVVAPTSGTYGSLCSPVALPGVNCFVYNESKSSSTTAVFDPATDVPANTPVIINAAVNATVAGATLASVANGTAPAGSCYVAPDGSELRRTSAEINVPALRGTWNIAASSNLRIAIDTPTGLQFIGTADEVLGNTYDLQGRQVEKAQNGVYVVNGKKQFVK